MSATVRIECRDDLALKPWMVTVSLREGLPPDTQRRLSFSWGMSYLVDAKPTDETVQDLIAKARLQFGRECGEAMARVLTAPVERRIAEQVEAG